MLGLLLDDEGIECLWCRGQTNENEDCPKCGEEDGRYYPTEEDIDGIKDKHEYQLAIQLVWNMRERPPFATEWLDQPALIIGCYSFLSNYFTEFDRRLKSLHAS